MINFESVLYEAAKHALLSISATDAPDVYAVSFYVQDDEDDPRKPTLTFGYNTLARWQECSPTPHQVPKWPVASDPIEAKWNYAFWLQNSLGAIGLQESDSAALREQWLKQRSLWRTDADEESNPNEFDAVGEQITATFIKVCVETARRLHEEGVVMAALGHVVPIIIHELEYYDEIAEQTSKANPPGLAGEFEAWVMSLS